MMRILNVNFHYSFVVRREQRRAKKGVSYLPVEKIYDDQMNLIFDENTIDLKGYEKTKYCKILAVDVMNKSLEKLGYSFDYIKTNTVKKDKGKYAGITVKKIKGFEVKSNQVQYRYDMEVLEDTLSVDYVTTMKELLQSSFSKLIVCNNGNEEIIRNGLIGKESAVLLNEENGNIPIEQKYQCYKILCEDGSIQTPQIDCQSNHSEETKQSMIEPIQNESTFELITTVPNMQYLYQINANDLVYYPNQQFAVYQPLYYNYDAMNNGFCTVNYY